MAKRGGKLGNAVLDLDIDDSKYTSNLDRQKKKTQGWMNTLGRDVKRGIGMGVGITGATMVADAVAGSIGMVKDVVAGSINSAIAWESAMAGVSKTVDGTDAEIASLGDELVRMSEEMPIASGELAGLAEAAGALGIAKEDIAEFTRITAMIGTTTNVSADQAATSLGQLSNVLRLSADDYERFGSTLVDLGNKGASTEAQILEIASRSGAGSKLIGMATEETLAWSSAVANLGIEVEAGGSSLQNFFLKSSKAITEGEEKLLTFARVAGRSAGDFQQFFERDASGALQLFLAELGKLTQGEQLRVLSELDFNDIRITRTLLGLANNAENLSDSLGVANTAWEENIALTVEAEKRYGTSESKLQILGNRVDNLAADFGENLLPALLDIATIGVDALDWLFEVTGDGIDNVAQNVRWLQVYFGDVGKTIEDWANDTGEDVGEAKDAVLDYMNETGANVEEAIEAVEIYGTRNAAGLERAGEAWEAYQEQTGYALGSVVENTEAGVAGVEGAIAEGDMTDEAAALFDPLSEEAVKAREASIEAMATMLQGISNLFETDETLRDAFQALLDRMDDPYTEAERRADVFSQSTIDLIRGAIQSGDPDITADTLNLVNNMLAQIALIEPGALEAGDAVPPALQAGMDQQIGALLTWIQTNVTGEALTSMSLAEAEELGLDGIWKYATGMRRNQSTAVAEARQVAALAFIALGDRDWYGGGNSAGVAWANGLRDSADWARLMAWEVAAAADAALHGLSPPKEGPLHTIDEGGFNVGKAWALGMRGADGLVKRTADGLAGVAYNGLAGARIPSIAIPGIQGAMGGAGSLSYASIIHREAAAAGGLREVHVHLEDRMKVRTVDDIGYGLRRLEREGVLPGSGERRR